MPVSVDRLAPYLNSLLVISPGKSNQFTRALDRIDQIAREVKMPIAIGGGLAGIHHNTGVTTMDIDLVVPSGRADELASAFERAGFRWVNRSPNGWHRFVFDDSEGEVEVEFLPAGQNSPRDPDDAPSIPEPSELGVQAGIDYADLPGWMLMKLVANRDKDRYHMGEAVKHVSETQVASIVARLRNHPPRYLAEFHRILQCSRDEDSTDW